MNNLTGWFGNRLKRRGLIALLGWLAVMPLVAQFTPPPELLPEAIYRSALPAVATLTVESAHGEKAVGTAFLALAPDTAVTAWHLVRDAHEVTARFADGQSCPVTGVLDWDEVKDVALVRLASASRPCSRLCLTNPLVGARTYVIGAPQGYEFSFSDGLVSQVQTVDGFAQYQTTCPISPGNSGGPLLNAGGEVLGVVSWSKNGAQNLNFATPAACLLELKIHAPVTPWAALPAALRSRRQAATADADRTRTRSVATETELHALQHALRAAAGRPLTIIVQEGRGKRAFSVTLPEDFVK